MKNSYLFTAACIFISAVVFASLGTFRFISLASLLAFFVLTLILLILGLKKEFPFLFFIFFIVFTLGVIRYNTFNFIDERNIKNYAYRSPDAALVQGAVRSQMQGAPGGKKIRFLLEARAVKARDKWQAANGLALVSAYGRGALPFRYGDIVILEGHLGRPFSFKQKSNFDYVKYLANKRIYCTLNVKRASLAKKIGEDKSASSRIMRAIYAIREKLSLRIEVFLDRPYSSVLEALLLGKRENISPPLKDLFAKTGTLHILAISGLHVGIIYFALRVILKIFRIPKNTSIIFSILFLAGFTVLAGARASIVRAALMFSIIAFGEMLQRKISIFNLIGLSCLMILAVYPNQVFDIGFIFSYMAVLSIVLISPVFYGLFSVVKAPKGLKYYLLKPVSISLAAWTGLLPIIAHYFGLISPVVVVANLIVIPLLVMIMGTGIFFVLAALLSNQIAVIFSQSVWFFIFVLIKSVKFLKNMPFAYFEVNPPQIPAIIVYYAALLFIVAIIPKRPKS